MRTDLVAENSKGVGDTDHRIEQRILFVLVDFHDDVIDRRSMRTKNGMFTNSFYDKLEYATGAKAIHLTKAEEERERSRMTPREIEQAAVVGAKRKRVRIYCRRSRTGSFCSCGARTGNHSNCRG